MMGKGLGLARPCTFGDAEAGEVWVPTDQASLALWFRAKAAEVGVTITDAGGGAVSQWISKVDAGHAPAQGTADFRPLISSINGNDSVLFDGVNDRLVDTGGISLDVNPCSFGMVFTPTSLVAGTSVIFRLRNASIARMLEGNRVGGDDVSAIIESDPVGSQISITVANTLTVNETRWAIGRIRPSAAGLCDLLLDEGSSATGSIDVPTGETATQILLGASASNGSAPWIGHMHEIILFQNDFIADAVRDDLAGYFNSEWVIS